MKPNFCQTGITFAALDQMRQATAVAQLGIRFSAIGRDFLCAEMPVDQRTVQPYGVLHGGASVLLAETIGSVASNLLLQGSGQRGVGVEISASHLRAVRDGWVTGICRPLRLGRSLHFWRIVVLDQQRRACCESRLTVKVITPREGG